MTSFEGNTEARRKWSPGSDPKTTPEASPSVQSDTDGAGLQSRPPVVEIRAVTHRYHSVEGEILALEDVTLTVERGEFLSIVGPSGCGKSTLLSLVAGLLHPSEGEVLVMGRPARTGDPHVGYMLQHDYLFEWRTILANALLGLEVRHQVDAERKKRVLRLLEECGLGGFAHRYPDELSGGMRQRAALVRTLALDPDLLLLDEPFGALDYQTRLRLEDEVGRLLRERGKSAILVTHDIAEAICMSDRVVVFSSRPGRIRRIVPIELGGEVEGPLAARRSPRFREYFDMIWRELAE